MLDALGSKSCKKSEKATNSEQGKIMIVFYAFLIESRYMQKAVRMIDIRQKSREGQGIDGYWERGLQSDLTLSLLTLDLREWIKNASKRTDKAFHVDWTLRWKAASCYTLVSSTLPTCDSRPASG